MNTMALTGIACDLWYLVFYYVSFAAPVEPGFLAAQGLLVMVLPMALGRAYNARLFAAGPTVLQVVLRNAALFLLYAAPAVWCLTRAFADWTGNVAAGIYHAVWLAAMWLLGMLAAYRGHRDRSSATALYTAVAGIPAILLLSRMAFSAPILLMLIGIWYFSLVFALAVNGSKPTHRSIVLFYALVPCLLTGILCAVVFSGSLSSFIRQVQNFLLAVWHILLKLLALLDAPRQGMAPSQSGAVMGEIPEQLQSPYTPAGWAVFLLLGMALAILAAALLRQLIQLLKIRIAPRDCVSHQAKPSLATRFRACLWAVARFFRALVRFAVQAIKRLSRRAGALLAALLPPRTPRQAVQRSYLSLLRWGLLLRVPRLPSETPLEYLMRLERAASKRPVALENAWELTRRFIDVQYGGVVPDWQMAAECRRLLRRIWRRRKPASQRSG